MHCTQGLPTIRAYGAQSRFRDDFLAQMDLNGSWWFAFIATARWVGFRLDNIAAAVLMLASIFVMALHSKVSAQDLPPPEKPAISRLADLNR